MTKPNDKFDATRLIVETLKDLDAKEQEMVFRWAAESLGLNLQPNPPGSGAPAPTPQAGAARATPAKTTASGVQDIKSFIAAKNPRSDMQFATAVAYWHQFVAPEAERKKSINEEDLLEACRKADRERPKKPYFTLNNAFNAGLLDRPQKGEFSVNSVGENLVAMTLPDDGSVKAKAAKKGKKRVKNGKRPTKNPSTKTRSKA
jgi:hypothetical protein